MSQFTKSLEKRIQELTAAIDAQKTELAAYERVLHMELSKGSAAAETPVASEEADLAPEAMEPDSEETTERISVAKPALPGKANKTTMVADVVHSYGSEGATPKDVDAYFTAHNIERSKNLVYNTLSYLVAHKKLIRREGKYFTVGTTPMVARKKRGPVPGAKKAAAPVKTGRKISPEGLQRIREALKKRWADKRAADAAATAKKATKKKSA